MTGRLIRFLFFLDHLVLGFLWVWAALMVGLMVGLLVFADVLHRCNQRKLDSLLEKEKSGSGDKGDAGG